MTELRWITRGVEFYPINEGHPARYVRVLQFREGCYDYIEKATGKEIWRGTDWQDVPDGGIEQSPISVGKS